MRTEGRPTIGSQYLCSNPVQHNRKYHHCRLWEMFGCFFLSNPFSCTLLLSYNGDWLNPRMCCRIENVTMQVFSFLRIGILWSILQVCLPDHPFLFFPAIVRAFGSYICVSFSLYYFYIFVIYSSSLSCREKCHIFYVNTLVDLLWKLDDLWGRWKPLCSRFAWLSISVINRTISWACWTCFL